MLSFDEFLTITPCTTGKHSTIDDTPAPVENKPSDDQVEARIRAAAPSSESAGLPPPVARQALPAQPPRASPSPAPPEEEESDDPGAQPQDGATCRRKGCGAAYQSNHDREAEECAHHPGNPLFHEGSKGYTCCKRRVLEFDEFMRLPGCKTKRRHLFVGKPKSAKAEEVVQDVRTDFYQTATSVIASLYLKKIVKDKSTVVFKDDHSVDLDLHTADQKRYQNKMELFGSIVPEKSTSKIMGTKLELTIVKADSAGWPVLRRTDPHTGEIIQAGRAGKLER